MEEAPKNLNIAIVSMMTIFTLERGFYRLKPIWKNSYRQDANALIQEIPDLNATAFYNIRQDPPEVGLLFGQFQGKAKKAKYKIEFQYRDKKCHPAISENNSFRVCLNKQ